MPEEGLIGVAQRIDQVMNELERWLRAHEAQAEAVRAHEEAQRWRRRRWRLNAHWDGLKALLSETDEP